jgi:hypothetical protein
VISGVPAVQDSFDFTIKVTDSTNPVKTDTQQLYIIVGEGPFLRGDANHDGLVDVGDVIYLISNLYAHGPDPIPYDSGDLNCDGTINVSDIIYLLNYLFKSGPAPC